jgi:predicted Zn-dependent protease
MKWIAAGVVIGLLGSTAVAQPPVHDPKLDAYVSKLGAELAQQVPYWTTFSPAAHPFTVYDDRKTVNMQPREPIKYADGPIAVPVAALANAVNEPVFAFQLAHAMAHVALRHSEAYADRVKQMQQSGAARIPGSADSNAIFLREQELEADGAAGAMLLKAGYSVEPVILYLERQPIPGFGARPITGSHRAEAVRAEMKKRTAQAGNRDSAAFEEARVLAVQLR